MSSARSMFVQTLNELSTNIERAEDIEPSEICGEVCSLWYVYPPMTLTPAQGRLMLVSTWGRPVHDPPLPTRPMEWPQAPKTTPPSNDCITLVTSQGVTHATREECEASRSSLGPNAQKAISIDQAFPLPPFRTLIRDSATKNASPCKERGRNRHGHVFVCLTSPRGKLSTCKPMLRLLGVASIYGQMGGQWVGYLLQ